MTLYNSWWIFAVVAGAVCAVFGVAVWMSGHLHPDVALHNLALFAHLASLVLGFGAVLVADYFIILWMLRRSTFTEAIYGAARLQLLVWTGLIGLVASGVLLEPNLSAGMTRAKLAFVVVLTLNGLQATILGKRMETSVGALSLRLLIWGAATTTVSQLCWWGSAWIGFWTATYGR